MQPPAHRKPTPEQEEYWRISTAERDLFFANLDLVLAHERDILSCDEYFFCRPEFTHYGVLSNGHINVGILLLGWRHGIFIDRCRAVLGARKARYECGGKSYVYRFGGLLSGTGWRGFCQSCGLTEFVWDSSQTYQRMQFASSINRQYRERIEEIEEYDGTSFSFGAEPLIATKKTRKRVRSLVEKLSVAELLNELKTGKIRQATPRERSLLDEVLVIEDGEGKTIEKVRLLE